ncbi:hypothetical protein GUJ93_ZPchr0004g39222 [Zizania palustris]|uniref:EGF-like calcium-binding domain-containing protein n=1 Tax=Zizania palustris TaxID=103762 RepID=A0A8J5SXC9_ZIZPA|nr:hypothetical protein GUJ93_ZPchr0004g39222 [Zizania palustris]
MRMDISSACYNESSRNMSYNSWSLDLSDTPYRYSNSGNRFTAIGCRTLAYIAVGSPDDTGRRLRTGCVATCGQGGATGLTNGTCSGIGCCQTAIPNGFQKYEIRFDANFNTTSIYNMSRCSYAALVEASSFTFSANYSTSSAFYDYYGGQAPIVVDWSIGNKTCNEAHKMPDYACVSSHSECLNSSNGPGYFCNCSQGFQGNPYLKSDDPGSCKDIDECKEATKYHCYGKCTNTDGGFHCTCPFGTRGDAYKGPCDRGLAIGICVSLLVALTTLLGIEWINYKHRIKRQDLMRKRDDCIPEMKFELTDKSDVYSFGVVLLELLTRRTPLSKDKVSLTSVFQEAMKEGNFLELIDKEIMHEDIMGLIRELAVLACQCLVMAGESRPAMSRVAEELRRLERLVQHHHGDLPDVSSFTLPASLATDTSEYFTGDENTGRYSTIMSIEFAR